MNDRPSRGALAFQFAVDEAYDARWWETHDNVVVTAYWMATNGFLAHDLALLIEKPWKWTDEYVQAMAAVEEDGGIEAWVDQDPDPTV